MGKLMRFIDPKTQLKDIYRPIPQIIPRKNGCRCKFHDWLLDRKVSVPGWKVFFHPQGTMYFHREEKVDVFCWYSIDGSHYNFQNVVTNVNLFNDDNFRVVEETIAQLFFKIEHDGVDIPPDTQLVIDIFWKKLKVGYYFASLQRRCLFWTHDKYVERLFKRVPSVRSYMHISMFYFLVTAAKINVEPDQVT